jgi:hypothetical protein
MTFLYETSLEVKIDAVVYTIAEVEKRWEKKWSKVIWKAKEWWIVKRLCRWVFHILVCLVECDLFVLQCVGFSWRWDLKLLYGIGRFRKVVGEELRWFVWRFFSMKIWSWRILCSNQKNQEIACLLVLCPWFWFFEFDFGKEIGVVRWRWRETEKTILVKGMSQWFIKIQDFGLQEIQYNTYSLNESNKDSFEPFICSQCLYYHTHLELFYIYNYFLDNLWDN